MGGSGGHRFFLAPLAANQINGMGMVLDVGHRLHGQHSGFERITGVVAGFDPLAAGVAVSHRVALLIVHGSGDGCIQNPA